MPRRPPRARLGARRDGRRAGGGRGGGAGGRAVRPARGAALPAGGELRPPERVPGTSTSGRWGARARSCSSSCPSSSGGPGGRVRVQQIPWSAAHEKLLTAYVGGAMPDVVQVGNTWIPELVALGALAPLDARLATSRRDRSRRLLSRRPRPERRRRRDLRRAVVRRHARALLPPRPARRRRPSRAAATWDGCAKRDGRRDGARRPRARYAILLPLTEWEPPVILALRSAGATLLRDGDRSATSGARRFAPRFAFYLELFQRGLAPPPARRRSANLYQDFARATSRSASAGRGTWASSRAGCPRSSPTAGRRRRCRRSTARRPACRSPAARASRRARHAARGRGVALIEFLAEPAQQLRLHELTGDLPARRARVARRRSQASRAPRPSARSSRTCARRRRSPSGSASRPRSRSTPRRRSAATSTLDEALAALDATSTRSSRSGAGSAAAGARRERCGRAGTAGLAPSSRRRSA